MSRHTAALLSVVGCNLGLVLVLGWPGCAPDPNRPPAPPDPNRPVAAGRVDAAARLDLDFREDAPEHLAVLGDYRDRVVSIPRVAGPAFYGSSYDVLPTAPAADEDVRRLVAVLVEELRLVNALPMPREVWVGALICPPGEGPELFCPEPGPARLALVVPKDSPLYAKCRGLHAHRVRVTGKPLASDPRDALFYLDTIEDRP